MTDMNLGDTQLILRECTKQGLLRNQAAYVLATAYWETGRTMEPVREAHGETDEQSVARLERAWTSGKLSWVSRPYWRDGFFGRGYVQLTHEANYARAGRELGVDMVSNPSLALEPSYAAHILVVGSRDGWFTGKRLSDYITLEKSNFRGARRIINGTDKAATIAELARDYDKALLAAGYGVEADIPVVNDRLDGSAPRSHPAQSTTNQAAGVAVLSMIGSIVEPVKALIDDFTEMFGLTPEQTLILIAVASVAWIFRERIRKWAEGDR